jgi:serine protease Do
MTLASVPVERRTRRAGAVAALMLGTAVALSPVTPAQAQEIQPQVQERPDSFARLAEQVSPAVVNITTRTQIAERADEGPMVPEGSPFEDFFREFQDQQEDGLPSRRPSALGSGFVISEDGYIVTNNHVIEGADEITIEFYPGEGQPSESLEAEVVGTDPTTDIALLKVEPEGPLKFVQFGDSASAQVGDWVMAMGNPLGQGFSVSAGIVSAKARALRGAYDDYIQTDAAINRGNSGGPLFNMEGEVIGVNTAILSPNGGSIGIGFAMSSEVVTNVVDQLQEFGETRRGWLGVRIQPVTKDVADAIGLADAQGALVTDVPEGPSREAGVQAGDVIVSFDGREVTDERELVRVVAGTEVGKAVEITVFRDGEERTLEITLGRREDAEAEAIPAAAEAPEVEEGEVLGLTLAPVSDEVREEMGLGEDASGLLVLDLPEDGEAFEKGVRPGDLITEAGQGDVATVADLEARVEEAREAGRRSILLLIRREGDPRFVALSLEDAAEEE